MAKDDIPHILKAMVRLSKMNEERRLKPPKKTTTKCSFCKRNGGSYDKKLHPKREDCGGTGIATNWRK